MSIATFFGNLKPIHRNHAWLMSSTRLYDKLLYYPSIVLSYLGMLLGKRSIRFLGHAFLFDNAATPLNMQTYPYEIDKKILRNMNIEPRNVLDIGGNIGQFSVTLAYFSKLNSLDIFEPNPSIIPMLKSNLAHLGGMVKIHNFALTTDLVNEGKMYFQPGRSAIGSIIENNAGTKGGLKTVGIKFCNDPAKLTGRRNYDLVKVDVEGFELEVVRALRGIQTKYLFLEVSSRNRERHYFESQLFSTIRESLGEYELAYSTVYEGNEVAYEILLSFLPTRKRKVA